MIRVAITKAPGACRQFILERIRQGIECPCPGPSAPRLYEFTRGNIFEPRMDALARSVSARFAESGGNARGGVEGLAVIGSRGHGSFSRLKVKWDEARTLIRGCQPRWSRANATAPPHRSEKDRCTGRECPVQQACAALMFALESS